MTLGASGKPANWSSSSRSARTVLTPLSLRRVWTSASEKRDTAITCASLPALSSALRASMAILGPILPAAPRSMTSPCTWRMSSISRAEGCASLDSSSSTEVNPIACPPPPWLSHASAGAECLDEPRDVARREGGRGAAVGDVLEWFDRYRARVAAAQQRLDDRQELVVALAWAELAGVVEVNVRDGACRQASGEHHSGRLALRQCGRPRVEHGAQVGVAHLDDDPFRLRHGVDERRLVRRERLDAVDDPGSFGELRRGRESLDSPLSVAERVSLGQDRKSTRLNS